MLIDRRAISKVSNVLLVFLCAFFGLQTVVMAETVETRIVDLFLKICTKNLSQIEKLDFAAISEGWKPFGTTETQMIGPPFEHKLNKGWMVETDGLTYAIGTSKYEIAGKKVQACYLYNVNVSQKQVLYYLSVKLDLKYVQSTATFGQRFRNWTANVDGNELLIGFETDETETAAGGILSAALKVN